MSKKTDHPPAGGVDTATVRLMVVGLADEEYAIPTAMVQAINPYLPPRPVPGSASHVEGVINLRGRLVPVVSLRARIGIGGEWSRSEARTVIVEAGPRAAGLVVDDVREVVTVDPRRYASVRRTTAESDALVGTLRVDGHRLSLLDVPGLLGEGALAA